jgi:N-acetylneuraminic acid mutarotase
MKTIIIAILWISAALSQVSPGGRQGHVMEQTDSNSFYMFGGYGRGNSTTIGYLNDVWKFDIPTSKFSHVKGPQTINGFATFGSTLNPANQPGARERAASTVVNSKIYVFGGLGLVASESTGNLADLWSFDPSSLMWLYLGGTQSLNDVGNYGGANSYSTGFRPGGRYTANRLTVNYRE